jgi:hypothetical protein
MEPTKATEDLDLKIGDLLVYGLTKDDWGICKLVEIYESPIRGFDFMVYMINIRGSQILDEDIKGIRVPMHRKEIRGIWI